MLSVPEFRLSVLGLQIVRLFLLRHYFPFFQLKLKKDNIRKCFSVLPNDVL